VEALPENGQNKLLDLLEKLSEDGSRLFAVMEGAHFENLQSDLADLGIEFRPLYITESSLENQIAGPHLVLIPNKIKIKEILALAGDKPCLVWWRWPDEGEQATDNIFKHLRSINMVEIPRDRYDAEPKSEADEDHGHEHQEEQSEYEEVLFRHADPNVLVSLLPLFKALIYLIDPEKFSVVFSKFYKEYSTAE